MKRKLSAYISILRPRQWLKNFALFAPMLFSGHILFLPAIINTFFGVIAFCLLSSSSYIVNDLIDLTSDRLHPFKKNRPLARRAVTIREAYVIIIALAVIGLLISWFIGRLFFYIAFFYLVLHYLNSFKFRYIVIIDILMIATFYILRVYAGTVANGYNISIWLSLSIMSLSLLIATGKRRAELTLIESHFKGKLPHELTNYSERMLNTCIAMFASATFMTYTYYTFIVNNDASGFLFTGNNTNLTYYDRKWLMLTLPFVLFGIMHYIQLIFEYKSGTMDVILTKDKSLIITGIGWLITTFFVLYILGI
jgi:4-hydroxybenzoate polyprenyltransferase